MVKFVVVLLLSPVCLAAPQEGFGDASPDEIAQIRAGTYLEIVDENPQYSFNYKVADDTEQTYMAMNENRDGDKVTGSYQYVDPNGALVVVTYTAGPEGYSETREVQEAFVRINPRPQKSSAGSSSFGSNSGSSFSNGAGTSFSSRPQSSISVLAPGSSSSAGQSSFSSSSFNSDDIVSAVISQVQPLISQTVSSAVSGASRRPAAIPAPLPPSDIVSQIVSDISPLVSQTVSSALSGSSSSSGSRFASRPAPAQRTPAPAPFPAPAPRPVSSSSSSGSINDLFGNSGDFNVRFNTPSFKIEY